MTRSAGQPTKYTPELVENARAYVDGKWKSQPYGKIPSHIGMAKYLKISRISLYEYASHEDKKEFSNILDDCMAEQQAVLLSNGLDNKFNSAIVKLVLGRHGFHEKRDTELTGANGGPLDMKWTVEIVKPKEDG